MPDPEDQQVVDPPADGSQDTEDQPKDDEPKPDGTDGNPEAHTHSDAEWEALTKEHGLSIAAKDKEIAQSRQFIATEALKQQAAAAESAERTASDADADAVDDGKLTSAQATERATRRATARETDKGLLEARNELGQIRAESNQLGRTLAANDFAKEYGIDAKALLDDPALTTPEAMEVKALKLQAEKTGKNGKPKGEKFDRGQLGSRSLDVNKMNPEEKIAAGLSQMARTAR